MIAAAAASPEQRARARAALRLTDAQLEADCELSFFVAGGPGGQHRNKAETAVRLVHRGTGVVATATERRSQAQNRVVALVRLREKLYVLTRIPKVRKPTKVSRGQKLARLEGKKKAGEKKRERKAPSDW